MWEFLRHLFDTEGFPPRWQCGWAWTTELGWLHIGSDLTIWAAYTAIPLVLAYFIIRRKDVPFPRVFWLFAAFIFFCGTIHLVEAIIFWQPVYRLSGLVKLGTAVVSVATVCALVPVMPRALTLRSPEQLEREVALRTRHLRESEEHQRVLMSELDHRVKNNIAAIMSLAEQTIQSNSDFDSFRTAFMGRLSAIARTHDALAASKWTGASLRQILDLTLDPYTFENGHSITMEGEDVLLSARAASSLCMAVHELATNSVKYGSLSAQGGTVSISWTTDDDGAHLHWVERGGPKVEPPQQNGFGTRFVRGVIEHDLRGTVAMRFPADGFECDLTIPTDRLNAPSFGEQDDAD